MSESRRNWVDIIVAAGLPVALLVVFLVDRFTAAKPHPQAENNSLVVRVIDDDSRQGPKKSLMLGVVPTYQSKDPKTGQIVLWDDMGKLLKGMGPGYDSFEIVTPEEIGMGKASKFDVLFLTCAPRGEELRDKLREFVDNGGTLYASDWRFDVIKLAFDDFVDPSAIASGTAQDVEADVSDPGLREAIGPKIHLHFDLDRWKTAAFNPRKADVLIHGKFKKQRHQEDHVGVPSSGPLLVKFKAGKGMVIFTSFHNEKQNSETERKLLEYLVFRLVTAGVDAGIQSTLEEGGFAPEPSNLLSAPRGNPTVTKSHTAAKAGPLRFALGFRNEGAKMRLQIRSPDGKSYTWEGSATVVLEVPDAVAGEWTYSITAVSLPYENFPFTMTVSGKK